MEEHPTINRPNIGLAYEIEVYDKDGNLKEQREEDGKCFVKNFLMALMSFYLNGKPQTNGNYPNPTTVSLINTSGATVNAFADINQNDYYNVWGYDTTGNPGGYDTSAAAGNTTNGLVLGTGIAAVTPLDYKLGTLIAHGSGAGQLLYDAVTFPTMYESGNQMTLKVRRMFTNSSGGDVTINEIGLYQQYRYPSTGYFMTIRDALASAVTLANGEQMVVTYKLIFN